MFYTVFFSFASGFLVYCVLKRVNQRSVELAVHAAVHEIKKEFQERHATVVAQMASKDRELNKARELSKLHQAVPTPTVPATSPTRAADALRSPGGKLPGEGLDLFAMSRPFTDTSYDVLMAVSDVVKVEPAAM